MSSNPADEPCQACEDTGWFYDHEKKPQRCPVCKGMKSRERLAQFRRRLARWNPETQVLP